MWLEWIVTQLSAPRVLSSQQIEIFRARQAGASYAKIQSMFSLSNPTALTRCLVRTALGFFWCHYHVGGRSSYLSDVDIREFKRIISERARQINCITGSEALVLAFQLRLDRLKTGLELLTKINCRALSEKLLEFYPPQEPDDGTVRSIWHRVDLVVCRPQKNEQARRMFRDYGRIANFFVKFGTLFERDPRLIWNAGEYGS
jgi:hypothetical protein